MAEIKAEMRQLKKKYEGTDQWMKAPNGKPTNLTEFQWLQVRTKAFKEWFGDWMAVAKLKMIDSLEAIKLIEDKSGLDIKEIYKNLPNGENKYDGSVVRFVNATLGKIISHKGYDTRKIIPQLKEIFDNSVPLDFEEEQAQPKRKDGSSHKQHPNFTGYYNYLGKFNDGIKDYYVRFTVQEQRTRQKNYIPKELHSTYISDVEIYEADLSLSAPKIIPWDEREIVSSDNKLTRIIAKIKSDAKNSSKIVDENGEPLVVYNGGKSGISIFDIEQTGKSNEFAKVGFWFSDEKSLAENFAKNWYNQTWNGKEYVPGDVYAVYLNIRNPKIYELELTHKMLQGVLRNYHDFSQVN